MLNVFVLTEYLKYLSIRRRSYFLRLKNINGSEENRLVTASAQNEVFLLWCRLCSLSLHSSLASSVNLFAVYPSSTNFLSKSFPRRWIPCWLLTSTAVKSAVTNSRCHKLIAKVNKWNNTDIQNFYLQSVWRNSENIKICGWITKLEALKMQFVCVFFHVCRKFDFFIFSRYCSVATWI